MPTLNFRYLQTLLAALALITLGAGLEKGLSAQQADDSITLVTVHDLVLEEGKASGTLRNHSDLFVSDVRLLLRFTWHWRNERRPGKNNPGRAAYYTVPTEIPPQGEITFFLEPDPPLAKRRDGRFALSGEVVSYQSLQPMNFDEN